MKYAGNPGFSHQQADKIGVIITNLGTPQAPTKGALKPYLKEFLSDPRVVEVPRVLWWLILNGVILNIRPKRSAEAYASVSGQNSNNSIRVTDDFLQAVEKDRDWNLISRVNGEVIKTIKARDLWEDVGHAAWACADPGIQFHDTVNAWHTCPEDGAIRGSNPRSRRRVKTKSAKDL